MKKIYDEIINNIVLENFKGKKYLVPIYNKFNIKT